MGGADSCQLHMWLVEQVLRAEGWNLNICHGSIFKSPRASHVASARPSQKCTASSAHRISHLLSLLHECLLASPPLAAQPISLLPFFFRQWEKWHLLMAILCAWPPRKPELFFSCPWRLPINSSNHQSAKYFQFRAHRWWMKRRGVIYTISSPAHVPGCWYDVKSSWLCIQETGGFHLQIRGGKILLFSIFLPFRSTTPRSQNHAFQIAVKITLSRSIWHHEQRVRWEENVGRTKQKLGDARWMSPSDRYARGISLK